MRATGQIVSEPSERLTWAQICDRYPDSWVSLVEVEPPGSEPLKIRSAHVIGHGGTRAVTVEQTKAWQSTFPTSSHYFTGAAVEIRGFPRIVITDEIRNLIRPRR